MGSPVIFNGSRSKLLTSKGLLLQSGAVVDNDGSKNYVTLGNFENNATTGWSIATSTLTSLRPTTVMSPGTAYAAGYKSFTVTSANATVGATYTNNSQTFTVVATITAGTTLVTTSAGSPAASGTLTKASGTGDATITFSTYGVTTSSSTSTLSIVSSGQLSGSYSLAYNIAGPYPGDLLLSNSFTIDTSDQAKVLAFKFNYKLISDTTGVLNWSGTSANALQVYIYDVTNGVWVQPAGVYNLVQNSGVGIAQGTFQTASNGSQYQIAVVNQITSINNAVVYFDDFYVGPQAMAFGPAVSDWVAWTPTGAWSANTTYTGFYRQVGSDYEYDVYVLTSGAPTSATLTINLPAGQVIDTTKITAATLQIMGQAYSVDAGVNQHEAYVLYNNTTSVQITVSAASGAYVSGGPVNQATPFTFGSGDYVHARWKVPISGKSSNTVMSNDTDTRVVSASIGLTSAVTPAANGVIIYDTKISDTHGAYSTSTGLYTIPVSGTYNIAVNVLTGTTANIYIQVNGVKQGVLFTGTGGSTLSGSLTYPFNAGDTLGIYPNAGGTFTAKDATLGYVNRLSINRLSGPAVVAQSESVNARYYASATSISGSLATVSWTTKDYDTHNAMSAGIYTIPVTGKYQVNSYIGNTGTFALNNLLTIEIQKNSTVVSRAKVYAGGVITQIDGGVSDAINCLAGDTIRIQVSNSGTTPAIVSSNFENWFSISRSGN